MAPWLPTIGNVIAGAIGGAIVWILGLVRDFIQADRERWREWRSADADRRERQRARLSKLYEAAVGAAQHTVWTQRRLTFQLQGEDPEVTKEALAKRGKGWQQRLDDAAVPLILEAGAQPFNDGFQRFQETLILYVSGLPFLGQIHQTVSLDDLQRDSEALLELARRHLEALEIVPSPERPRWRFW